MIYQDLLQKRKQRGYEIAQTRKVINQNGVWIVPSATNPRQIYKVQFTIGGAKCNCPDFLERGLRCKHIFAVDMTISKQFNKDGTTTITQTKRITYPQNWKAYNTAQINEQELFMKLLSELCQEVEEPLYTFGRPRLPLKNMVFSSALKVYSTFSLRRFIGDMKIAVEKGYLPKQSSFTAVGKYMQNPKLTSTLNQLIILSAMPLRTVETKFAIDSTGFRTTRFNDYCREKHNTGREHTWIKAHICTGVETNVITGVEITDSNGADSPQFIPLLNETARNGFTMEEVSADKAYNSKDNYNAVNQIGAVAYIPFKSNTSPWGKWSNHGSRAKIWRRMYHYFQLNQEEFLEHYHLRSNVESTINMVKSKFTDLIRSRDGIAQKNEVLLKVLCHNIVVLIQEMHELGIEPQFCMGV
jgi:transposase